MRATARHNDIRLESPIPIFTSISHRCVAVGRVFTVAAALLAPLPAIALAQQTPTIADVDAIFAQYDSSTTPGCAVAVMRGNDVVMERTYGMAHIGFAVRMSTATTMWVPYSEARVFTALAVAMLARDARLSLTDSVRRHVPELPAYAANVTIRQLLHHTSGLADYGTIAGPGWQISDRMSEDEMFRLLTRWGQLVFPSGEQKMYSNSDYALLKILVERITGGTLHAYLSGTLFQPLGMTSTRVGADQGAVAPDHALFHEATSDGFRSLLRYRESPVGGIAVTTSVDDLVRFSRGLRDTTTGLQAMLEQLKPGAFPDSSDDGYSFGLFRGSELNPDLIIYRGVGEYNWLTVSADGSLSVIVLCNAYKDMFLFGPALTSLYTGAQDSADAAPATTRVTRGGSLDTVATVAVSPAELQRYVGEYRTAERRRSGIIVDVVDNVLRFNVPDGRRFLTRSIGGGRFEFIAAPGLRVQLAFAGTDSTEDVIALRQTIVETGESAGDDLYRFVEWQPGPGMLQSYPGAYVSEELDLVLHVSVDADRVLIAGRGLPVTQMSPMREDAFEIPDYRVLFHRDARGRITHLTLNSTRVRDMRYTRRASP